MIAKYNVEYAVWKNKSQPSHYLTDDPVACEEFIGELLERKLSLVAVKHEGVELPQHEFDRMVKSAAATLAGKHIAVSLGLKAEEVKYRFGYAA
jgi:hypothetical protein